MKYVNPDAPAFPQGFATALNGDMHTPFEKHPDFGGLSVRAELAARFTAALLSHPDNEYSFRWINKTTGETRLLGYGSNPAGPGEWEIEATPNQALVRAAIKYADTLIEELNKTAP